MPCQGRELWTDADDIEVISDATLRAGDVDRGFDVEPEAERA
jgi:hypothetical protein